MTDTLERLSGSLRPADAPDSPTDGWRVDGMETATWASRKAAEKQAGIDTVNAWRDREIERINQAADAETKTLERDLDFFRGTLGAWLQSEIMNGRKKKSIELPGGTIAIRARQPTLELDEEKAMVWAQTWHPDLIRVKASLDRNAVKKAVEFADGGELIDRETGEVLEIGSWRDEPESVSFTPVDAS